MVLNHLQVVNGMIRPKYRILTRIHLAARGICTGRASDFRLPPGKSQGTPFRPTPGSGSQKIEWMGLGCPEFQGCELREFRIFGVWSLKKRLFWISLYIFLYHITSYNPEKMVFFYKLLRWTWKNLVFPTELWIDFFSIPSGSTYWQNGPVFMGLRLTPPPPHPVFGWFFWCFFSRSFFETLSTLPS